MPVVYDTPSLTDTYGGVIDDVISQLMGATAVTDAFSSLSSDLSLTDLSIKVDDVDPFSRGVVEIDSELFQVVSVDQSGSTLKVTPRGRGFRGTTPSSHTAGATVTMAPTIPRSTAARAVANEVQGLFPSLFGTGQLEFVPNPIVDDYPLPAECVTVLDVRTKDYLGNWERLKHWEFDVGLEPVKFPTGKALRLPTFPYVLPTRVVYATRPAVVAEEQPFTDTGLSASMRDVVVLGALVRLLPMFDMARLSTYSASSTEMNSNRQFGSGAILTRELKAQYQQRLLQEQTALKKLYPARWHVVR